MYLESFANKEDIANEFQIDVSELENCNILFASYKQECYEGSALVIYMKDGKLYETSGSHCSCNGLEGCWDPEETSLEALKMRNLSYYGFSKDAESLLVDLIFEKEVLEDIGE